MEWRKKKRGCATIYKAEGVVHAIVNRNGFGAKAAAGGNITYNGFVFQTVEDAKVYAEQKHAVGAPC